MKRFILITLLLFFLTKTVYAKEYNQHLDYWLSQEEAREAEEKTAAEKKALEEKNKKLQQQSTYPTYPEYTAPEPPKEERHYTPIGNREKDIYTFSSQDGNIYHLVIEPGEKSEDDRVALLAQVREQDLISLAAQNRKKDGSPLTDPLAGLTNEERKSYEDKISALEMQVAELQKDKKEEPKKNTEEPEKKEEPQPSGQPKKKNNLWLYALIGIFFLVAVYFKIIRPKQISKQETYNTDDIADQDEEDDYIDFDEEDEKEEEDE